MDAILRTSKNSQKTVSVFHTNLNWSSSIFIKTLISYIVIRNEFDLQNETDTNRPCK